MAKRIPPNKVDEIYSAVDIVDVVGDYVTLKRRGSNHVGLSPWTNEKTPSFTVSPAKGIYKDFSSGKGGNAVSFVMEMEGFSYVEALIHLAKKYGIEVEVEESPEEYGRDDKRESLFILNEFASKYFNRQLTENDLGRRLALTYFKERGILESTISDFMLGYAPDEWDAFVKEAARNQFSEEIVEASGLAFRSERDNKLLDRFKGRIIFPIHNHSGRIAGFGGRIIGKQENTAKYINSPETETYNKSRILYGLWQGRQAVRNKDEVILVEGYMDVVSLHQSGIRNAVASSGTALTEEQCRLVKRFTRNVMLIYDADRAGINAAMRGVDLLLDNEMNIRVLLLPQGHDPDSFVQEQGSAGFEAYLKEHSVDFIEFRISRLMEQHNVNEARGKSAIIHETAETLARIVDPVQLAVYTEMAAKRISISENVMAQAVEQARRTLDKHDQRNQRMRAQTPEVKEAQQPEQKPPVPAQRHEQETELLRLMLNYPERILLLGENEEEEHPLIPYIHEQMEELEFADEGLEQFRRMLIHQWNEKKAIDLHRFINHENAAIAALTSRLVTVPLPVDMVSEMWSKYNIRIPKWDENLEKSVEDALDHFRLKKIKSLIAEIQTYRNRQLTAEQEMEVIRKQMFLDELKRELSQKRGITLTWDVAMSEGGEA